MEVVLGTAGILENFTVKVKISAKRKEELLPKAAGYSIKGRQRNLPHDIINSDSVAYLMTVRSMCVQMSMCAYVCRCKYKYTNIHKYVHSYGKALPLAPHC